jgi:hypothetical protein
MGGRACMGLVASRAKLFRWLEGGQYVRMFCEYEECVFARSSFIADPTSRSSLVDRSLL